MSDIKVKVRGAVKTLDKTINTSNNIKSNLVSAKDKLENTYTPVENENEIEYASNKINNAVNMTARKGINKFDEYGQKSVRITKQNIEKSYEKTKEIKNKIIKNKQQQAIKKKARAVTKKAGQKGTKKTIKSTSKTSGKYVKSATRTGSKAIKTTENVVKTAEKTAKATAKAAQKTAKAIKVAVKTSAQAIRSTAKAVMATIKAIIAAVKGLIAFLVAGGWIVVVIVLVICMIGFLISSIFGIFFSNDYEQNYKSMSQVVNELNIEFMNKITAIQKENPYEEFYIEGSRADWKDVLAVYVAKYSNGNYQTEMMSLDDKKIDELKKVFWDMNEITFTKDTWTEQKTILHLTWTEYKTIEHTKLHIKITSKNAQQMADRYLFNPNTRKVMDELLKDDFLKMWSSVIYGSTGNTDIVEKARSQLGNAGGQPYWSWYGFNSRVEWCAVFVSWCANECGYIEKGIISKFAGCEAEGVAWFQACGLWEDGGCYTPKPGDIIFFDWANKHDGSADHVGIVEKVENGRVYTIEGNSGDSCKQRDYDLNSEEIRGYGTPMY